MAEYKDYKAKQNILGNCFSAVSPREFYEDIFPPEGIEARGMPEDHLPNPIIAYTGYKGDKKFMANEIIFRDFEGLAKADKNDFAICSMCSYSGRKRTAKNAYKLHGITIDLDGVGENELHVILLGVEVQKLPAPTYVVNSGHGLHLYYVFENPVPLYPKLVDYLQRLKVGLTYAVWTRETSYYKPKDRQFQGIYQGFRMPGSCSKIGKGKARTKYLVTAYRWWRKVSIEYLNQFVEEKYRMPVMPDYSSYEWSYDDHLTLQQAREKYPEWYEKRIVRGEKPGRWVCNRALYYWWLKRIQEPDAARDGNRYNCIATLFIYGVKCEIGKDYVMADALELVPVFDALTINPDNAFTEDDVVAASKFYDQSYVYYSINAIEARTGIKMKRRKKGVLSRAEVLEIARTYQNIKNRRLGGNWRNIAGAPLKKSIVLDWRKTHPIGTPKQCIQETGLSKNTVYKWWRERLDNEQDD